MFKKLKQKQQSTTVKTLPGVTSFYVVIFAIMLFTIIVIGFVNLILSEANQTLNDQLSASAYDSAQAGIEDAKLAIMNCLASEDDCGFLSTQATASECNSVAEALGRNIDPDTQGVLVDEKVEIEAAIEMLQAYTCVIVSNDLIDYRAYLSTTDYDSIRLVPLRADPSRISDITGVRISWYAAEDSITSNNYGGTYDFRNYLDATHHYFGSISSNGVSRPPTIAVQLIQTDAEFSIVQSEVDYTVGNNTDRGMLFLVPANGVGRTHIANSGTAASQTGAVISGTTRASGFVKANDKSQQNSPYIINCDPASTTGFICSATIELPDPVQNNRDSTGQTRGETTNFLVVSLPYGQPATDFAVELCTDKGDVYDNDGTRGNCSSDSARTNFVNAQYSIDSTGRANDVYRRVEVRVEVGDTYFPYPQYALHLTGNGDVLNKYYWSTYSGGYPRGCWSSIDGAASACPLSGTSGKLINYWE